MVLILITYLMVSRNSALIELLSELAYLLCIMEICLRNSLFVALYMLCWLFYLWDGTFSEFLERQISFFIIVEHIDTRGRHQSTLIR